MIDFMKKPEVEYDDSADGNLTVTWWSEARDETLTPVIRDGSLTGVRSTRQPPRGQFPWRVTLPRGLIKIDCSVVEGQRDLTESNNG